MTDAERTHRCAHCNVTKPFEDFAPSMLRGGGWCKLCVSSRKKAKRHGEIPARDHENCLWRACGKSLAGRRRHAKFCSTSCSMKHWHDSNPGEHRKHMLKSVYGLSPEAYDDLIVSQSGLCAICLEQMLGRDECVDHEHETGRVRGLLCQGCNQGLGRFRDDAARLRAAADYVTTR